MSTQQERKYNTGPGYNAPSSAPAAAAQTSTASYRPTAAHIDGAGQGLAAIGQALGGFFNSATNALAQVDESNHRQDLVQIERENKALEWEATADQRAGREANPAHMDRMAYVGTYTTAAADEAAFSLSEGLKAELAKMPLDGSVTPQQVAQGFFKQQIGAGTGDKMYDARLMYGFTKQAESQVSQQNELIQRTVESNAWETVRTDAARQMVSQNGVTVGQVADLQQRILTMARGNQVVADKQLESILGEAIQNDGQALSALNALQESGYAQRNPDSYLRLSQKAFEQTNKIKTWQAGTDVQQWQMDFNAARVAAANEGRDMAPQEILGFAKRAHDIDSKHGVGPSAFNGIQAAWVKSVQTQAAINVVEAAMSGAIDGIRDGGLLASRLGVSFSKVMSEHFDSGMAAYVRRQNAAGGVFRELAKSMQGGLLNPLASPQAALEFAGLLSSHNAQMAAPGGMSDTYKSMMGNAIVGNDPVKAATAFKFFKAYEDVAGTPMVQKLFGSSEAANRYAAVKRFALGDQGVDAAFKHFATNPLDEKDILAERSGEINWRKWLNKPDAKPHDIEDKVTKGLSENLRDPVNRNPWFRDPPLILGAKDRDELMSLVAQNLRTQGQLNATPDLKQAIKDVSEQFKSRYITLPGQGRALQLLADPYGGKGRELDHPVNTINGRPVYAGFPIKNRLGEQEDPVATYRSDVDEFSKKFPGLIAEGTSDRVYLGLPNAVSGLHPIMLPNQLPLTIRPGQEITMPVKVSKPVPDHLKGYNDAVTSIEVTENQKVTLPRSPSEMKAWLEANLPAGVYPVESGWKDPKTGEVAYDLQYGFRVKGDQAALQQKLKKGEERIDEANTARAEHRAALLRDEALPVQLGTTPIRNYRRTDRGNP